jgi:hypothetical protein
MILTTLFLKWLLVVLGIGGLVFWHHIVHVFANHIIPFFRKNLGDSVADAVASVIGWIDGKVVLVRNVVAAVWRMFKEKVLGIKVVYKKTSATTATRETVSDLQSGPGQAKRVRVTEESIPLDELPADVRRQLISQPTQAVEKDMKDQVTKLVRQRAVDEGIPVQELGMTQ